MEVKQQLTTLCPTSNQRKPYCTLLHLVLTSILLPGYAVTQVIHQALLLLQPRGRSERISPVSSTFVHLQLPEQHGSKRQQSPQPHDPDQKVCPYSIILGGFVHGLRSFCAPSKAMDSQLKHGQPLTTLIRRLEAATSRLEDIATSVDSTHPETVAAISSAQATIAENAATAVPVPAASVPPEPLPRSIEDFDKLISDDVKPFVTTSEAIGGLVEQQVSQMSEAMRT